MELIVVITACYTLVLVWYVLTPKLQAATLSQDSSGTAAAFQGSGEIVDGLSDQRERFMQVLRDLELDYQTEKISTDDYATMRASVSAELGQVLAQLDEVARTRASKNSGKRAGSSEVS